jgi:hypothetical protein
MTIEKEVTQERVTEIDLILAEAYFKVLVEIAKSGTTIFYGELVQKAKTAFPDNATIQRSALATNAGRRLNVVRMFTIAQGLPDLSSLVINQSSNECGEGFLKSFDPEKIRSDVFSYNWESVDTGFADYVLETKQAINLLRTKEKKKKTIKLEDAVQMMSDHYKLNKGKYPKNIRENRDQIIKLIIEGIDVEDAFNQSLKFNII